MFTVCLADSLFNCLFCSVAGWCSSEIILDLQCLFLYYLPSQ